MADSVSITANIIEGSSLSSNITDGSNIVTSVTEGVSIAGQVAVGGKGDKGDTGDQGPQGDTGPQGEQGIPGEDGLIQSIVAGDNIAVDNTDPANPIISAEDTGTTFHSRLPRSQIDFVDDASTAWDDYYNVGDGSLDTSTFVLGSSSVKVTTQDPASYAAITRELSPVSDLSQSCVRLFVRSDSWGDLDHCTLILSSNSYTLSNTATLDIGTRLINPPDNEWIEIIVPRSAFVIDGTMNWSSVDLIMLRIRDTGTSASVWLDSVMSFDKAAKPTVSITFDDGFDDTYLHGKRLMDKYGYAGTAYIVPSLLGDAGFLTDEHVEALASIGWDISGHNFTNLTALTPEQLETELSTTKDYLVAKGYRGSEHYAYPNGAYNEAVNAVVRKYFSSGANIDGWNNSLSYISPYRINRQSIDQFTTVLMVKGWIDDAIANNEWVILNFHGLVNSIVSDEDWLIDDFEEIIDYLNSEGVEVRTVGEALDQVSVGVINGPPEATNNAVAVFDGATGKLLKDTPVTIQSSGLITTPDSIIADSGSFSQISTDEIDTTDSYTALELTSGGPSAVNHVRLTVNPSGSAPIISAIGTDTNIGITLAPKGTGTISADTSRITSVTNPTSAQDAATKSYVDGLDGANVKTTGAQTVAGVKTFSSAPKVDTINENTAANGVTVDGLNIKDSKLNTNDSVVTTNITDDAVTAAKLINGVVYRRQGGSSTVWSTPGTTTYDVSATDVKIQTGSIAVDSSAKTVTYPVAFTNQPVVFLTVATATSSNVFVRYKVADSDNTKIASITTLDAAGSVITTETVNWLAIGV